MTRLLLTCYHEPHEFLPVPGGCFGHSGRNARLLLKAPVVPVICADQGKGLGKFFFILASSLSPEDLQWSALLIGYVNSISV